MRLGIVTSCVAVLALSLGVGGASAKTVNPYVYVGSFNGTGSTAGAFQVVQRIAVNDVTGNVYVTDREGGGVVSQFNANGTPVPFSDPGLTGASSIVAGPYAGNSNPAARGVHIAVDNTNTASQGNIYVNRGVGQSMLGLDSSGKALTGNWPLCGSACGNLSLGATSVAVDPNGIIWTSSRSSASAVPSFLAPFNVSGELVGAGEKNLPLTDPIPYILPVSLGIDTQGNFYVGNREVSKFDSAGKLLVDSFAGGSSAATSTSQDPELAIDRTTDRVFVQAVRAPGVTGDANVVVYSSSGEQLDTFGELKGPYPGIKNANGIAVNSTTDRLYVGNNGTKTVDIFDPGAPIVVPDVATTDVAPAATSAVLTGTVDPAGGGEVTDCHYSWGTAPGYGKDVPCEQVVTTGGGTQTVTASISGLTKGTRYHFRLFAENGTKVRQGGANIHFRASNLPVLSNIAVREVVTNTAKVTATINPEGGATRYFVEYGPTASYGSSTPKTQLIQQTALGGSNFLSSHNIAPILSDLTPGSTYHYRIVVENDAGVLLGPDRSFNTFAFVDVIVDDCPNTLSRQQTGAALLLHCRAYELVSAGNAGGYSVESDLVPGQAPFAGFPQADDRVLYGVNAGVIPGTGNPTNRGLDPYVATRGADGWSTSYVGIPANGTPSEAPFASTLLATDSQLESFAFGGPDICDPCFTDESAGLPVRLPNGQLVQGMVGSLPVVDPEPSGDMAKPMSADGTHLVFGSEDQFEADGNNGSVSIYDRNLVTGVTKVVSKTPGGATMSGAEAAEHQLDISEDGSRILLGDLMGTDGKGNEYFHLYMNVGASSKTIDLTPGTTSGVRYDGMTSDGTSVFFSTKDPLTTAADQDTDSSADLFRAEVSSTASTLVRVSTGTEGTGDGDGCTPTGNWNTPEGGPNCDVFGIAGGGGVASDDGTVYFFSPEKLDGSANGVAGQPNFYAARPGVAPNYIQTLEVDNNAVVNGVADAGVRRTADFQIAADGDLAAFGSELSLTGFENVGFSEVFVAQSDDASALLCVSCAPSNAPATASATLASNGLSISDDGRVFFNSDDALVLGDSNGQRDVYEWTPKGGGRVELISSGHDPDDSSLLTVTSDGRDVFFFTHESLVSADENGALVKLYDARTNGGFFVVPPKPPCVASDECHGSSSQPGPPPNIRTIAGTAGNHRPGKSRPCRKGFVKKKGRCVKKKPKKAKNTRRTGR